MYLRRSCGMQIRRFEYKDLQSLVVANPRIRRAIFLITPDNSRHLQNYDTKNSGMTLKKSAKTANGPRTLRYADPIIPEKC